MSDKSKIEWTEATWNPVTGCNQISPGCKQCYAKIKEWPRLSANSKSVYYGRKFEDVAKHPERLDQPLRWRKPRRIFVNSMSDLFHQKVSFEFIAAVFGVMMGAKEHTFQILTKRPERAVEFLHWLNTALDHPVVLCEDRALNQIGMGFCHLGSDDSPWPLPNVQIGISVESQLYWEERAPHLSEIAAQGWFTWASFEPLLGPIQFANSPDAQAVKWAVAGGESGHDVRSIRPCHPDWIRRIRRQCGELLIPFNFKQWGNWTPQRPAQYKAVVDLSIHGKFCGQGDAQVFVGSSGPEDEPVATMYFVTDKHIAGRELDGQIYNQFPQ